MAQGPAARETTYGEAARRQSASADCGPRSSTQGQPLSLFICPDVDNCDGAIAAESVAAKGQEEGDVFA
jgi:hypothetical protein